MWSKKQINVIPNIKSKDKENRKKLPKNIKIPTVPKISLIDKKYITQAIKYVKKYFTRIGL